MKQRIHNNRRMDNLEYAENSAGRWSRSKWREIGMHLDAVFLIKNKGDIYFVYIRMLYWRRVPKSKLVAFGSFDEIIDVAAYGVLFGR